MDKERESRVLRNQRQKSIEYSDENNSDDENITHSRELDKDQISEDTESQALGFHPQQRFLGSTNDSNSKITKLKETCEASEENSVWTLGC